MHRILRSLPTLPPNSRTVTFLSNFVDEAFKKLNDEVERLEIHVGTLQLLASRGIQDVVLSDMTEKLNANGRDQVERLFIRMWKSGFHNLSSNIRYCCLPSLESKRMADTLFRFPRTR